LLKRFSWLWQAVWYEMRHLVAAAICSLCVSVIIPSGVSITVDKAAPRPNILVLLIDDMG
jgi:hypothetical protein